MARDGGMGGGGGGVGGGMQWGGMGGGGGGSPLIPGFDASPGYVQMVRGATPLIHRSGGRPERAQQEQQS